MSPDRPDYWRHLADMRRSEPAHFNDSVGPTEFDLLEATADDLDEVADKIECNMHRDDYL